MSSRLKSTHVKLASSFHVIVLAYYAGGIRKESFFYKNRVVWLLLPLARKINRATYLRRLCNTEESALSVGAFLQYITYYLLKFYDLAYSFTMNKLFQLLTL